MVHRELPTRGGKGSANSKMLILNTYESIALIGKKLPTRIGSLATGVVPPSTAYQKRIERKIVFTQQQNYVLV